MEWLSDWTQRAEFQCDWLETTVVLRKTAASRQVLKYIRQQELTRNLQWYTHSTCDVHAGIELRIEGGNTCQEQPTTAASCHPSTSGRSNSFQLLLHACIVPFIVWCIGSIFKSHSVCAQAKPEMGGFLCVTFAHWRFSLSSFLITRRNCCG